MLEQRALLLQLLELDGDVGEGALGLRDLELRGDASAGAGANVVERLAPRRDGLERHGDLRVEGAQREIGLRRQPRERQRDLVLRVARVEQLRSERLRLSPQAAPEIQLVRG